MKFRVETMSKYQNSVVFPELTLPRPAPYMWACPINDIYIDRGYLNITRPVKKRYP